MRSSKSRSKGKKNKAHTEKRQVQNQWSDDSSDAGKLDQSEYYDTEEDESMAVLGESIGMMMGENLPAKQREKYLRENL